MENSLIKEIKNLRKEICPRPEWKALTRDVLLKEISASQPERVKLGIGDYFNLVAQIFRQNLVEPVVVMILMMVVFLGSSLTINAAFYSLPGSSLYPVKIALENTHAALVTDANQRAELKIEFAQKRVAELDKIIDEPGVNPQEKKRQIETLVAELKNNVTDVNNHISKMNQSMKQSDSNVNMEDKERTVKMALTLSSKAQELVKSLDTKVEKISAADNVEVKDIVSQAVQSVQDTSLSAQQLAQTVNEEADKADEGTVKGVTNDSDASLPPADQAQDGAGLPADQSESTSDINK
ncbi:MAG: DUF5667 domain-containing protein [Patescibacteria group bacterium]|jgi:hypothetical protein